MEAENPDAAGVAWIEFLKLELGDGMRGSGDEQGARCIGDERCHRARSSQSGERLSKAGRTREKQAGKILSGAGQSIEIVLG
jgi:hypothetical protein